MENKRIIKIVFIIIAIIIVSAIIEISIRSLSEKVNKVSEIRIEEKQEKADYYSSERKTERLIKSFILDMIDAINDKDYAYVFGYLDDEYKEYMFANDINSFKSFLNKYGKIDTNSEIVRIEHDGGRYQVLLGTSSGDGVYSKDFTLKITDDDNIRFMFGEYTAFRSIGQIASYSKTRFYIRYCYETSNTKVYVMDVTCNTTENVNVEFTSPASLILTNGKVQVGNMPDNMTIVPNDSKRIELIFMKNSLEDSSISFDIKENNEPQEVTISLVEDIM